MFCARQVILAENTSMEEPRARGVSLWLMPAGPTRDRLAETIGRLAARLGTRPFAPHVTLLPGLPGPETGVLERARELAAELEPVSIDLEGVSGHDAHFRCLFFRVADAPALRKAHERAARRFGREPDPAFEPHLSLVYGTLASDVKARLRAELAPDTPGGFLANRLHVWRTEGVVGEWHELEARGFGPAPARHF
jgi:2'-5' RNA ligase